MKSSWSTDRIAAALCDSKKENRWAGSFESEMLESAQEHDAIELKKLLGISYESALKWIQGRADKWVRNECRKALEDRRELCPKTRARLDALCEHYGLLD